MHEIIKKHDFIRQIFFTDFNINISMVLIMNKLSLLFLSIFASLAGIHALADEITSDGTTIITDNFKVVTPSRNSKSLIIVKKENEIGTLGDKVVVSGQKNPEDIAYVKNVSGTNYIIKNKLLVQCAKNVNCIPSGLDARSLSTNVYEITITDYDQWKSLQKELKNADGIRKVTPSFYHGNKPQLK